MAQHAATPGYLPASTIIAVAAHAVVVLGLQFLPERSNTASRLEVTLASWRHDEAPEEADFIAQENQLGSGSEEEKLLITTTDIAIFPDNTARPLPRSP